jgi:hypothetical protein
MVDILSIQASLGTKVEGEEERTGSEVTVRVMPIKLSVGTFWL